MVVLTTFWNCRIGRVFVKSALFCFLALTALQGAVAQQSNEHKTVDVQQSIKTEAQATIAVKRPTVDLSLIHI